MNLRNHVILVVLCASCLTALAPVKLVSAQLLPPISIELDLLSVPTKPAPPPAVCPPPDGTRPDPTLAITDAAVLQRFPLARVYQQLIDRSGAYAPTSTELHQQLWDALDSADHAKFSGPHCSDNGATINGFPIACPRPETVLKETSPDSFAPVALFNRFDLTPSDGSHCGEYRIIYAQKDAALTGRNLLIFEGVLPNPNPGCGVESCRPVVDFWEGLAQHDVSSADGQTALADALERFYFAGIDGFEPVVDPNHYGPKQGQIRANLFSNSELWQLREFQLATQPDPNGTNKLVLAPVTVKTNPYHELFNTAYTGDARASAFQSAFPAQSKALSTDQVANISMSVEDQFNAGQSTSQDKTQDYALQYALGPTPNAFGQAIQQQLSSIQRGDLTARDIAARATTQSCAGCHQISNGVALGGKQNPVWPASRKFVHVDESGNLSPALWCSFLPARKAVLDGFAASAPAQCKPGLVVVIVDELTRLIGLPTVEANILTISGKIAGPN